MIGQQLHTYLRGAAGYERSQVGPFLATFTPSDNHPNRNYAVPADGVDPTPDQIAALIAVYESRDLRPRLEYASSAAPLLGAALVAAGFTIEATIPVLTCEPGQQRAVGAAGFRVSDAAGQGDHEDAIRVAAVAYGEPVRPIPDWAVAARLAMVAAGGGVAVARETATGQTVGSGLYPAPIEGVNELAAVGTLPSHRQQGVASSLMAHLAGRALRGGVRLMWLTAEHDPERKAALEASFHDTGEVMVHISRRI